MMVMATATEMQNNFGHYLNLVMNGQEVIVTKNGKEVARVISRNAAEKSISESLVGILSDKYDLDTEKERYLKEKYESAD